MLCGFDTRGIITVSPENIYVLPRNAERLHSYLTRVETNISILKFNFLCVLFITSAGSLQS
jgi:hypothetical protein